MDLAAWLLVRADEDTGLSEDAKLAVLAALEGEDELDQALGGRYRRPTPSDSAQAVEVPPVVAFLKSITVAGFRGVGAQAALTLNPSPGLVVVAGRNGSGKSSFAEALEVALTGDSYRGRKKLVLWRENWRNLHHRDPCRIEVQLAAEGQGLTRIGVEWSPGADLADRTIWTQSAGGKRQSGLDSLGWARALELYRPLLSYDELGGMLEDVPSRLHDALESFLGLEQLTDAAARLAGRAKQLREPQRRAKEQATAVRPALELLDDARARTALVELKKRSPDLGVVRALLAGSAEHADPALARLTALSRLTLPEAATVIDAANELAAAVDARAVLADEIVASSLARDELLEQALAFHAVHGDGPCPVCGTGRLDQAWTHRTHAQLTASQDERSRLAAADRRLGDARQTVTQILAGPFDLGRADGLPTLGRAEAARRAWHAAPVEDALRAQHVRETYPELAAAVADLVREAAAEREARQDRWAEVVVPLSKWVTAAQEAATAATALTTVDTADKWIKVNLAELRNQRLEPLADKSRAIWAKLRQESNVDLGSIRLEGTNTRRRADLHARVDGDDAGALAVMSQGELHALALALFVPRAASDASPFGFVVLDDPIQAMDPSKIDGFVRVLTELATQRQVVVFTHDDRLPEALRRGAVPARILEITRGHASAITVTNSLDPAQRYLDDAYAVAKDDGLVRGDKARVIPGLCRLGLEAACRDHYYAKQLGSGAARREVEDAWQNAQQTRQRVILAVDPGGGSLDGWLTAKAWRKRALGICTTAVHAGLAGDPVDAVNTVRKLVDDIRQLR